jgi:hypothetical protein
MKTIWEDFKFEAHYYKMAEGSRVPYLRAAWAYLQALAIILTCKVRGHQYESWADAENGSEEVMCRRCGYGFHHYMTN